MPGIDLISYSIAAFNACERNEVEKFSKLEIHAAIAAYFKHETLRSFELDFASPGNYVVHSKRAALSMFAALLVSATVGDITLAEARTATVRNSADSAPNSPHEVEIKDKFHAVMEAMGAGRYNDLIKLNKAAQDGVGLKVPVKRRHHR